MKTQIKTPEEIENLRISGRYLAEILEIVAVATIPGVTTQELDDIAALELKKRNVEAAFLGYNNFPANICISVNDEIVHGLPGSRIIQEGDLVGLDFGVTYNGMITDSAVTVGVGKISDDAKRLLRYTQQSLTTAIATLKDGVRVGTIGAAIEAELEKGGLKVIDSLGGHGVGHHVHEDPFIANFGTIGTGESLKAGMTIALEPIASLSTHDTFLSDDGWTYMSADKSLSAQFEHTVLITQDGAEILTIS